MMMMMVVTVVHLRIWIRVRVGLQRDRTAVRVVRSVDVLVIVTRTRRLCKFPLTLSPFIFFFTLFCAPSFPFLPYVSSRPFFYFPRQNSNKICFLPICIPPPYFKSAKTHPILLFSLFPLYSTKKKKMKLDTTWLYWQHPQSYGAACYG